MAVVSENPFLRFRSLGKHTKIQDGCQDGRQKNTKFCRSIFFCFFIFSVPFLGLKVNTKGFNCEADSC